MPMIALIAEASKKIFVPLTVGGGIRAFTDSNGVSSTALQVPLTLILTLVRISNPNPNPNPNGT